MSTDAELLAAWREGDKAAGSELFNRYFEPVRRFFATKVDEGVEDFVQATFLSCVNRRDSIKSDLEFGPYLFAAARNKLYDHYRKHGRAPQFDPEQQSLADLGVTPSSEIVAREDEQLVMQALRRLPVEMQVALELYYFEGLRGPQLAVALDVPEGTVRSRLRRGLEQLRKHVDELVRSPEARRETATTLATWAQRIKQEWGEGQLPE